MGVAHNKGYDPEPGLEGHNGHEASERVGLLSGRQDALPITTDVDYANSSRKAVGSGSGYALKHLLASFATGLAACFAVQFSLSGIRCPFNQEHFETRRSYLDDAPTLAKPWAGSTVVDSYPPTSPVNVFPSLFPTNVGYPGATPTGAEPGIIATAPYQPLQTGAADLVTPLPSQLPPNSPSAFHVPNDRPFDILRSWGNLSPWYSVPVGTFGIHEGAEPPAGCKVKGLHFLYRHGARYCPGSGGPAGFAAKLHQNASQWNATGRLAFLNDWTYKLGAELLTPFGRQEMFDLGVSMRLKYGFLLDNFTAENRLPVFRTESQDRMHASGVNFALGFFGWPTEGQYEQVIMIESSGFNNTLAPYDTCNNANNGTKGSRSGPYIDEWTDIYLKDAQRRLQADLRPVGEQGLTLEIGDVYSMQEMCAYETVAIGYSKFCELFTEDEWEGFGYSIDLQFWYNSGFGSPVAAVQGLGYVQELVARLTHTPIETYNSSTNSTLDGNPITFPLENVLYADATHDVVIANILTALNLTTLAATGPLPGDHIPAKRSFRSADLVAFGANVQFQLLSCPADGQRDDTDAEPSHIRIVVNDGPVPLTGVQGCPHSSSGLCPLSAFIAGEIERNQQVDWNRGCYGDWEVPAGPAWQTTDGMYPA